MWMGVQSEVTCECGSGVGVGKVARWGLLGGGLHHFTVLYRPIQRQARDRYFYRLTYYYNNNGSIDRWIWIKSGV